MSAVVNLTELAEARAKMTPGEYNARGVTISSAFGHVVAFATGSTDESSPRDIAAGRANAAGIVAEHSAVGVLIEVARAAMAYVDGEFLVGRRSPSVRWHALLDVLAKVSL